MKYIKDNKNIIVTSIFILFIVDMPFMNNFLMHGHDIGFHLGRIEGLAISLSNGDFLGRINPVNGYGYASGIMYPQLFLYIPAFLRLFGFSLMNAYKFFVLLINAATFAIAYISFKNILQVSEKYIAMLAGAFYVLGLYRLSTLYLRAALGEVLGMTFFPLLLWGMYELFIGKEKKWWIAVIGWTCVLQSHFLTAEMALVFCSLFFLVEIKRIYCEKRLMLIMKAAFLTMLLNAFFIVPFIHYFVNCDFQVFHIDTDALAHTAVYFSQMFSSAVTNSGSMIELGTSAGEMPTTIGTISLVILFGYVILRLNTTNRLYRVGDKVFLLVLLLLWAVSDLCPWGVLYRFPNLNRLVSSIQFLFRLFSPLYLFLTILFVIVLCVLKEYVKESIIILVTLGLIWGNCSYYLDSTIQTENVMSEEETEREASVDGLYLYNDFPYLESLYNRGEKIEVIPKNSEISIRAYRKQGSNISFQVAGSDGSVVDIEIPLYYYPTYRAQLDDVDIEIEQGTNGVVRLKNISQNGTVRVWFPEQPLWMAADMVSLCAVLWCVVTGWRNMRLRQKHRGFSNEEGKQA